MRPCVICKDRHGEPYATREGYDYLRCSECGLIYVNHVEGWEKLYRSYDGGPVKSMRRKMLLPFRRFHHARRFEASMVRARKIISFVSGLDLPDAQDVRLLDVGCNKGFLLEAVLEKGWDVWGNEVVPELTVPFKKKHPRIADQVVAKKLADASRSWADDSFSVVTAIDVIEHFEDPRADLRIIRRVLQPGGLFVVQTPDTGCARAAKEGDRWRALKPLEHLHLFDAKNLERLSRQVGFKPFESFSPFEEADGNFVAVMHA